MSKQSEVALIREWIDREVDALQQLRNGFAKTASHDAILHHYHILDVCHEGLAAQIGDEQATEVICERVNQLT